jgi:hypothetical protein
MSPTPQRPALPNTSPLSSLPSALAGLVSPTPQHGGQKRYVSTLADTSRSLISQSPKVSHSVHPRFIWLPLEQFFPYPRRGPHSHCSHIRFREICHGGREWCSRSCVYQRVHFRQGELIPHLRCYTDLLTPRAAAHLHGGGAGSILHLPDGDRPD